MCNAALSVRAHWNTRPPARLSPTTRRRDIELINPSRWYDPISERWIEPREMRSEPTPPQPSANHVVELQRTVEIKRIWRALVDCCARE